MKAKLSRAVSLSMVILLLLPITAFGQPGSPHEILVPASNPGGLNGPPLGFDPANLRISEIQPVITGEITGSRDGQYSYLILLKQEAVPTYLGGLQNFAATSPQITGAEKLDVSESSVQAYANYLGRLQSQLVEALQREFGRSIEVQHRYVYALNGLTARLMPDEASQVAEMPGVLDIQIDRADKIATDVSPEWVGATGIWDGSATGGLGTRGEGIVIGIIDSGINMDHPSFAAIGGDGYVHQNPLGSGVYLGWCNPSNPNYDPAYVCNDKLIGAWDYADASWTGAGSENDGPNDNESHGSHVASTAAGNYVDQATLYAPTVRYADSVSGIAPHANIIAYDACGATGSCYSSDVVAAVEQAIIDGADVINESIGIGGDPFTGAKQIAYLNAVAAGIFYARAAGNEGPGAGTVGPEPAWTLSAAALTHNRKMFNALINLTGGANPPANLSGLGFTAGYGPAEIVYSAYYTATLKPGATAEDARLCAMGNPDDTVYESPWEDGAFDDQIVVCDRGIYARIEKGYNVQTSGAGGFVLADDGNGVVADSHYLPGLHISYEDGMALKGWLSPTTVQTATITGYLMDYSAANGDLMAGFSSRGPVDIDLIKPDAGAPGVDIWAAWSNRPGDPDDGQEYGFKGGTSMASPQIAGMAALLKSLHPTWTPSEIKSALMTTAAHANTRKEGDTTPTDPFDVGSGRARVDQAARSGLLFDETPANYVAADEGNVKTLNLPSFADRGCYLGCSWTRTVTNPLTIPVTWSASMSAPAGTLMSLAPASLALPAGGALTFTLTVTMTNAVQDEWLFGSVTLTPNVSGVPQAYLPVAVVFTDATDANVLVKDVSLDKVNGLGIVDYTLRLANPGTSAVNYALTDTIPANAQYIPGSAWGGLAYDAGTESLTYQGAFDAADVNVTRYSPPYWYGYYPMSLVGIEPFPLPSDPDEGGWELGGLDFYYLGQHYNTAIWSVNGTLEAGTASGRITGYVNFPLPYPDVINNLLAPWWGDINLADGGNWYLAFVNDGTYDYTVFEWENAPEYGTSGNVTATFQIWMITGTDYVWFAYHHIDPAWYAGGTVGIENNTGMVGDQYYIYSPYLAIGPIGTPPNNTMELWVDFGGSPPLEMGFSALAVGPSNSLILNEAIVRSSQGSAQRAWASTRINPWMGVWLPLLIK